MRGSAPCPRRWSTAPRCMCSTSSRCGCRRRMRCHRLSQRSSRSARRWAAMARRFFDCDGARHRDPGALASGGGRARITRAAFPSAGLRRSDRRCRRRRPSARFRCRSVRQRHRHRRFALWWPVRQPRHHDEGDTLRVCGGARSGSGVVDAPRLHRLPDVVRSGPAKLRRGLLSARLCAAKRLLDFGQTFRIDDPAMRSRSSPRSSPPTMRSPPR